jgi:signal transduction histidine kinase
MKRNRAAAASGLSRRLPRAPHLNGSPVRAGAAKAKPRKEKPSSPAAGTLETWARQNIFSATHTAAWEGSLSPLEITALSPEKTSFIPVSGKMVRLWSEYIHPLDKQRAARHFEGAASQPLPVYIDYRLIDNNGSIFWVRHSVTEAVRRGARPLYRGFISDIQAEKDYQLESLRVSEREQNRIGQDLHDDLCQVLAGVSCLMRVAEGRIASKVPDEVEGLREINQQVIDAMHRTRALTHGLFPGRIQIADIRGALLELAEQTKARFKVEVHTRFSGRFRKHTSPQIIQIYRIAQEAMSNAIKHGRASSIDVSLSALRDNMELAIRDNGTGLGKPDAETSGVGLHIMHYRAGILGGELAIANGSPNGVTVWLRYPLDTAQP